MAPTWSDRFGLPAATATALHAAVAALADPSTGDDGTEDLRRLETLLGRLLDCRTPLSWLEDPLSLNALIRLAHSAPFLLRHLASDPGRVQRGVLSNLRAADLPAWPGPGGAAFVSLDEGGAFAALRRWKYDCYAQLTARNLLGLADAAETCAAVTAVAEGVTRAALLHAFSSLAGRFGIPVRADGILAGMAIIGMGKLGGGELNYSSDIDLILVHDGDDAPCRPLSAGPQGKPEIPTENSDPWERWNALALHCGPAEESGISNGDFFQRLGKQTLRLLSTETEDGFCFRTDSDLRPQGRSGMLVPSLASVSGYYDEQGREWERTALIKSRCIAGSLRVGARFAEIVRPFVYRRYLDFSAMEGVALIKHDIDRQQGTGGDGNLKIGRGGIRESEFLVQALQLVHGGRVPALQVTGHAAAARALADAGVMEPSEVSALLRDYWVLRHVENRVQMLDETQVHELPKDPGLRRRVLTNFDPNFPRLSADSECALNDTRKRTAERYQRLFAGLIPSAVPRPADWRVVLEKHMAPTDAQRSEAHIDGLLNRLMRTRPGEQCVFKLERMLTRPELYVTGTESAFPRWTSFLEQVGNRNSIYALLEAHPEALAWSSRIFAEGGRYAPPLIRHPEFMESFLSLQQGERLDTGAAIRQRFERILATARDEEEFLLDLQMANAHARLLILSRYLELDAHAAQPDRSHRNLLSDLADAGVDVCARFAWRYLVPRYGLPQDGTGGELSGFAVLALGKLGSRELRFGSDLDLVFAYRGDGSTSKGRSHWEFYTKLAQKLTALLSAPTQFGMLQDLDHRLRPFGGKGLLVPSLTGYEGFFANEAEVWNFQAFTRARHVSGEQELAKGVLGRVAQAWMARETAPKDTAREVLAMARRLSEQAAPTRSEAVQLKYGLGGMLGFEFLRQCHFLLERRSPTGGCDLYGAGADALAASWTPPRDHEIILRLMPDYDTLGALDERVSFYIEPYRHEVDPGIYRRYAGVGRRWSHEQIATLCERMHNSVVAAFQRWGA